MAIIQKIRMDEIFSTICLLGFLFPNMKFGFSFYLHRPALCINFSQWKVHRFISRGLSLSVKKTGHGALGVRRRTRGSGLCGSPEEVVACQCCEERASTWSGCNTQSEANASHSVGVVKHVAAHDLSLSCRRVKLMIFSATAALLTLAQASESLP